MLRRGLQTKNMINKSEQLITQSNRMNFSKRDATITNALSAVSRPLITKHEQSKGLFSSRSWSAMHSLTEGLP